AAGGALAHPPAQRANTTTLASRRLWFASGLGSLACWRLRACSEPTVNCSAGGAGSEQLTKKNKL
ncbi:MAG: hypothetical protein FWD15_05830, partial [Alphaproteobacteria bacterium]|nr:hypothetical protein [Alphaproteobacteria bacterium]